MNIVGDSKEFVGCRIARIDKVVKSILGSLDLFGSDVVVV
jgi:hypothetical protein